MPDEDRAAQLSPVFLGGAKQGMTEKTRSGDGANLTIPNLPLNFRTELGKFALRYQLQRIHVEELDQGV